MNSNELKSRGLGDTVAKITAATKMDKLQPPTRANSPITSPLPSVPNSSTPT